MSNALRNKLIEGINEGSILSWKDVEDNVRNHYAGGITPWALNNAVNHAMELLQVDLDFVTRLNRAAGRLPMYLVG